MRQEETIAETAPQATRPVGGLLTGVRRVAMAALLGALLVVLAYQVPSTHQVDLGRMDAAYTQGFYPAERTDARVPSPLLIGSDGAARWSAAPSFLVFPQIGLPATLDVRLRGPANVSPGSELIVLLNGLEHGRIVLAESWTDASFSIEGGLLKPSDVVIELRATRLSRVSADDPRSVGALIDRASLRTSAWPIMPYPGQVVLGALAAGLFAWVLGLETALKRRTSWLTAAIGFGVALAFLLLYRLQLPYAYPLRGLLVGLNGGLAGLLVLRYGPPLVLRVPVLLDLAGLGGVALWLVALLGAAQQHVTLSRPGVETDFSVFARRSAQLNGIFQPNGSYDAASDGVLRADGFYNLGYPLLLWLLRPFTNGNPFLAARLVAAASAALLLLATWWLARRLLGPGAALVALLCLALSPFVVSYGLFVGTDAPFAAACALALALLLGRRAAAPDARWQALAPLLLAGVVGGAAFLLRHPGLLLLPFGWAVILWQGQAAGSRRPRLLLPLLAFSLGFVLAAVPQLAVNLRDTGNPLYSQQAKNIWLAVYGNSDWANWDAAPNTISLGEVLLADPPRFVANWLANLRGFVGAGGEDTSEFGRADQLRLLAFPANWLAVLALAAWLLGVVARTVPDEVPPKHHTKSERGPNRPSTALLVWVLLYAAGVLVGLGLLRFALPLVPVYAVAAAWALCWLGHRVQGGAAARLGPALAQRVTPLLALLLMLALSGGFATGVAGVLAKQPADELAAIALVQQHVGAEQRVQMNLGDRTLFDEYSAIAHLVVHDGQPAAFALRRAGEPALPNERPRAGAGPYVLYERAED